MAWLALLVARQYHMWGFAELLLKLLTGQCLTGRGQWRWWWICLESDTQWCTQSPLLAQPGWTSISSSKPVALWSLDTLWLTNWDKWYRVNWISFGLKDVVTWNCGYREDLKESYWLCITCVSDTIALVWRKVLINVLVLFTVFGQVHGAELAIITAIAHTVSHHCDQCSLVIAHWPVPNKNIHLPHNYLFACAIAFGGLHLVHTALEDMVKSSPVVTMSESDIAFTVPRGNDDIWGSPLLNPRPS